MLGLFVVYPVLVDLTPEAISTPVLFPVRREDEIGGAGPRYVWDESKAMKCIIGMRGVADQVMLCFTPTTLFVFPRKEREPR